MDHADYKRCGNDLIYTKRITLQEALAQKPVTLKTLDGRCLTVTCADQISPQSIQLVRGEGMPITAPLEKNEDPMMKFVIASTVEAARGDLYVRFDISFPTTFSQNTKT